MSNSLFQYTYGENHALQSINSLLYPVVCDVSISAGDPEFDLDPDSSRSDIGAIAFDPRFSVPKQIGGIQFPELLNVTAFPNPFNGQLHLSFNLVRSGIASIKVLDITGREVDLIVSTHFNKGIHNITWNTQNLPSGLYVIILKQAEKQATRKVLLIK